MRTARPAWRALDANRGNLARTARQVGVPRKTLAQWARSRVNPTVAQPRHQQEEALADALERVARRLLDGITPQHIAAASLLDIMKAASLAVDKMLLLRGGPVAGSVPRLMEHPFREFRKAAQKVPVYSEPDAAAVG